MTSLLHRGKVQKKYKAVLVFKAKKLIFKSYISAIIMDNPLCFFRMELSGFTALCKNVVACIMAKNFKKI